MPCFIGSKSNGKQVWSLPSAPLFYRLQMLYFASLDVLEGLTRKLRNGSTNAFLPNILLYFCLIPDFDSLVAFLVALHQHHQYQPRSPLHHAYYLCFQSLTPRSCVAFFHLWVWFLLTVVSLTPVITASITSLTSLILSLVSSWVWSVWVEFWSYTGNGAALSELRLVVGCYKPRFFWVDSVTTEFHSNPWVNPDPSEFHHI